MIALVGAALAFVAVFAGLRYALGNLTPPAEAGLARLLDTADRRPEEVPFTGRVVSPLLGGLAGAGMQFLPHSFVGRIGQQLVLAGRPMSTEAFFTFVALTGLFFPGTLFVLLAAGGRSGMVLLLPIGAAVLGLMLPFLWLRRKVRARKLAIWKSLPDAFDLVTVCVEAGLGLDAALRHVCEKLRGPLSDEIAQTLREVGMGRARREALEEMAERGGVKELTTFVNAVIQAEQLGTSLGRVLRAQGITMRVQRRQRAEEMAQKAPVKLVFPLVLFIMPTFFIVTLGPIVIHALKVLSE